MALLAVVAVTVVAAASSAEAATTERWQGADRYATSVRVSQEAFPSGADVVFLATGQSFPDALAAGPAAATLGAPILLATTNQLPSVVSVELQRLSPSVIYLLGGFAAISSTVEAQVAAATTATIERVAGSDRYATAAAVTELAFPSADVVYVAAGGGFADALSAGAPGGILRRPVLLTGANSVPAPSREQIARLANPDIIVLGGTAAVSNTVVSQLDSLTTGTVRRVQGANRYSTSVAVSVDAFAGADTVFLATGTAFPDALGAAPAATPLGAPILLTTPTCAPTEVVAEVSRLGATRVIVLGGINAVSNAAADLTPCPVAPPDPFTYTGQGTAVVEIAKPTSGPVVVELDIQSTSNTIVWSLDTNLETNDLLVNEIGNYQGVKLMDLPFFTPQTTRYLDITATGLWTVRVRNLTTAPSFDTSITGQGDRVLRYTGPARVMRLTHDGPSNFIVWNHRDYLATSTDSDLVVNVIGPYDATRPFQAGPALIEVTADGNWSIGS